MLVNALNIVDKWNLIVKRHQTVFKVLQILSDMAKNILYINIFSIYNIDIYNNINYTIHGVGNIFYMFVRPQE